MPPAYGAASAGPHQLGLWPATIFTEAADLAPPGGVAGPGRTPRCETGKPGSMGVSTVASTDAAGHRQRPHGYLAPDMTAGWPLPSPSACIPFRYVGVVRTAGSESGRGPFGRDWVWAVCGGFPEPAWSSGPKMPGPPGAATLPTSSAKTWWIARSTKSASCATSLLGSG